MERKCGHKVYCFIECYGGRKVSSAVVDGKELHVCPMCGRVTKRIRISDNHVRDVCEDCSLSFDYHERQTGCHKIIT